MPDSDSIQVWSRDDHYLVVTPRSLFHIPVTANIYDCPDTHRLCVGGITQLEQTFDVGGSEEAVETVIRKVAALAVPRGRPETSAGTAGPDARHTPRSASIRRLMARKPYAIAAAVVAAGLILGMTQLDRQATPSPEHSNPERASAAPAPKALPPTAAPVGVRMRVIEGRPGLPGSFQMERVQ